MTAPLYRAGSRYHEERGEPSHRSSLVLLEQPCDGCMSDASRRGIDRASFQEGLDWMDNYEPVEMNSCIALLCFALTFP